jgi:two-component system sensor histidine kinase UhpB
MAFTSKPLNLLVVEDNVADFVLFDAYLQLTNLKVNNLCHAKAMSEIIVSEMEIDIAFLDLSLPDSGGIESFTTLNQLLPHVPIVVLSGLLDETIALQCIAMGAQDYLLKDELNEKFLEKSVYYSIERKKNLKDILKINRQYELIGSVTNDVIWNWDVNSNEITCTKKDFFGYAHEDIEENLDWWMDRIHPDDKEQVTQAITNVLNKKTTTLQVEYRFRLGNGNYHYLFNRGALLPARDDESYQMIGAIMDITERKKLEDKLVNVQLNLQRQMTEATILGQEKQKEEIGKELHDNINQILASVKLFIDTAISNEDMIDEMLVMSKQNIMHAITEVRKLSHSLVPPSLGDHGLVDAVKELIDELNIIGLFNITLSTGNFDEAAIDGNKKLMLYRIVQEQSNNIIKYAEAQQVSVTLNITGSGLVLLIADDGVGFDMTTKSKGIGLKNIDSRVAYYSGNMQLHSAPGKGTTLEVFIPL